MLPSRLGFLSAGRTTLIQETIGYEPSRTITESVGEFIAWYEANREWEEPLVRSS